MRGNQKELTARKKNTRHFQGRQIAADVLRKNEAQRNDRVIAEAEPPAGPVRLAGKKALTVLLCDILPHSIAFQISLFKPFKCLNSLYIKIPDIIAEQTSDTGKDQ